ncbi:MAG: type II toxin-antitoxin system VapC family toxin [Alphaproteobacteria bacterium]
MTPGRVVDASALAAVIFGETESAAVAGELADARLFAPPLLQAELANVCLTKIRRTSERREQLLRAWNRFRRMDIAFVDVDIDAALRLAETTGLTVYDATYLRLSRDLGAALVTLDRSLAAAYRVSPATP